MVRDGLFENNVWASGDWVGVLARANCVHFVEIEDDGVGGIG